jgi:hypothetical protein
MMISGGNGRLLTRVFLTSGTSWTVDAAFNSADNNIECIGGGGGGSDSGSAAAGQGGGYSKIVNLTLTPGAGVTYAIGAAGAGAAPFGSVGGDTYFNGASLGASSCGAKGGGTGLSGSVDNTSLGVGTTKYNGGYNAGAGKGGGAAGPNGAGTSGLTTGNGGPGGGGAGGTDGG